MYPARFDYRRPATVPEALEAIAEEGTHVLAGGHSLLPAVKARALEVDTVVDVSALSELAGIDRADGVTIVRAGTTYAVASEDEGLARHAPMVSRAIAAVGDRQIRNRGTVGGNLVQADPGADIPAAALAADASVRLRSRDGVRDIAVAALYDRSEVGNGEGPEPAGSIQRDELLTGVRIPDTGNAGSAYLRKTHQATGYALVGVAARVWSRDGGVRDARIAATGVRRHPIRLRATERVLVEEAPDPVQAGAAAADELRVADVRDDPNVSARYRVRMLEAYTERATARALRQAARDGGETDTDGGAIR